MDTLKSYGSEQPDFDEAAILTDTELAALVRNGDNDSFAELWARHERSVAHVASQSGANHNNREDFVQDTAEKLLRDLQNNERDFDNASGARNYAASIARRRIVDSWRRAQRHPQELTDEFYDSTGTPYESAEDIATVNFRRQAVITALQAALAKLPSEQAEAFTLTHLKNETRKEYSKRTGIGINTISTRTRRAKAKLEKQPELRHLFDTLDQE
jgi:RNA polymerase sigma-70 factor (ECF subfamily)